MIIRVMAEPQSNGDSPVPKNVIIIGGSLSGLMHGVMLHRLGSNVRILEQSTTNVPESHMAGVVLGADVLQFLKQFDRIADIPLGIPSVQLQSLDEQGKTHAFMKLHRLMSSWDALYYRLRANFDLLASEYVPCPPAPASLGNEEAEATQARARYEVGKRVVGVDELDTGQVLVRYQDLLSEGNEIEANADLILGADGPNSLVRKVFSATGQTDRKYSGHVAWRGTVPEHMVSEQTRRLFRDSITYLILKNQGGHVIVYSIPGKRGSVELGERMLNFCWYTNVPASGLVEVMTDVDGQQRHTKLPPGKVRPEVWEKQRAYAGNLFAPAYLEIIQKIDSPFVHLITDFYSPQVVFAGGRVLLVGDASTHLRPHIGFSTNQAAYHTLLTQKLVTGIMTTEEWEYQTTVAAYLHWKRSIWFSEFFQRPLHISIVSAVSFWATSALAKVRTWMGWLPEQAV
ncbi:FAD/NAD(P)-binding domain-containing protein [Hypoxylon argillaceum]|nr:FAD/NAD(P)-binding domain-containing protein [Hypoxylon argillaceum]